MNTKIYISGMHSGQNPSSGLGIARCLRDAFPDLTLVGVDHWQGSSGLHADAIDETLLLPLWSQLDNERHAKDVRQLLDDGNLWISSMDLEVHWMSENIGPHTNLLAPGGPALEKTAKPAVKAFEGFGFKVPEYISTLRPDSELHAFLRHHSWQCYLKSQYHDAQKVNSWSSFEHYREAIRHQWRTTELFLQRHVIGHEECICFAAYKGELIEAVHMEKRQLTPQGKTWAGKVTQLDPETKEKLRDVLRSLEWSGGGELEYTRDPDGQKWIIECNPRFPAWTYGGALAGINLPAHLVAKALGWPFKNSPSAYPLFNRVVTEVPAKEAIGIPTPPPPTITSWSVDGKKGGGGGPSFSSFLPQLKDCIDDPDELDEAYKPEPETIPTAYSSEVDYLVQSFTGETPARLHMEWWTQKRFQQLVDNISSTPFQKPEIRIGYSVKTSSTDNHLQKAKKNGFYFECINQMEVHRSLNFGVPAHRVILNGPGKFWPTSRPAVTGLHMLFSESIEEFERVVKIPGMAKVLGFRIRVPNLSSRFGISIEDFDNFRRVLNCIRQTKGKSELGFHFHMPSWAIGVQRWAEAFQSLLLWCHSMEKLSGVPVQHLDLGGGFFPDDLAKIDFARIQESVHEILPSVEAIYFEPGRALTQDGEMMISRVLDIRRDSEGDVSEVVVDACIAELPLVQSFPHRIFYQSQSNQKEPSRCQLLQKGSARILGRICMENDILVNGVEFPNSIELGDFVIIGDAGGYERSMSYDFGRG